jgi:hypothetical protein
VGALSLMNKTVAKLVAKQQLSVSQNGRHRSPIRCPHKLKQSINGVGAIVLRERILHENKTYVKITIINGTGNIMPVYNGAMISVEGVSTFVGKSKSNLVVNQMQCPLPQSQLNMSQLALGQMSHMEV